MKETDRVGFAKLMTATAELYGKKVSSMLLNLYWLALKAYDFSEICRGLAQHITDPKAGQFMPKPADIARCLEGENKSHALQAWSEVELAIQQIGRYGNAAFSDPLIAKVIAEMGGWSKLCSLLAKEMPFYSKEFTKRYLIYSRSETEKNRLSALD